MNYKCQSLNCDSKPMCYCQCTISPIFLCNLHTIEHFKTNKVHKINDILIRPIPETRLAIIQKLKEIKTSINNSKYLVNSDSFEIIKLLNKLNQEAQNHFKSLIKKCNDLIRIAMQDEIFEIKDGNCIENLLRLQHAEAEARLRIWNVHEITINSTAIQELIAKNFDISKFDPLDWLDEQNLCSNDILLFKEGTKQLINYNLSSLQVLFLNQDILRETINSDLSLCVLPNKSKFCYGNDTGLAFVIDHKNDISMIENGKPNSCFSSNYYENFVYAIGGASKLAEKYNLQTNKWESCAPIPYDYNFNFCRSSLFKKNIVIVGYHLCKPISYDVDQNYYFELPLNLTLNVFKFIFAAKNRVYIGELQQNVFESFENDLTRWNCISKENPVTEYQISYYTLIDNSVFFSIYPSKIFEFNLGTKQFEHIKNL